MSLIYTDSQVIDEIKGKVRHLHEVWADEKELVEQSPYRRKYCGQQSWVDPSDQNPPADYCHDDDHFKVD